MLNKLPQLQNTLIPNCVSPTETVEYINNYIQANSCENMSVDISFMNVLDACYVTTLCATTHYIKYPQGKISWKISSDKVREFNKDLELGNSNYIV
ncbi:MAG: hypothetical protein E7Z89_09025 [Cyanobacteria bacterium SIG28]|nr:hypothetical protein [Cyanobacteria bacterium SIG28]